MLKEQLLARTRGTSLVFPNAKGEQWNRHRFGEQVWQPGVEAAGYESLGFHQLRHGDPAHVRPRLPARVGAERVGHADGGALILKRYRHLVAEAC